MIHNDRRRTWQALGAEEFRRAAGKWALRGRIALPFFGKVGRTGSVRRLVANGARKTELATRAQSVNATSKFPLPDYRQV